MVTCNLGIKTRKEIQGLSEIVESQLYQVSLDRSVLKFGRQVNTFHDNSLDSFDGSFPLVFPDLKIKYP